MADASLVGVKRGVGAKKERDGRRRASARSVLREGGGVAGPQKEGVWWGCQTCKRAFTGAMQRGLAEARWSKGREREQEDGEWQMAALMMARALGDQGKYGEAK